MNRSDGIALLRERCQAAKERLAELAHHIPARSDSPLAFPWVVTGLGSSEAHARYLVALANRHQPGSATFLPTTAFATGQLPASVASAALICFSQGLSANAQIALHQRARFRHTVLFTAATEASLETAGKAEALALRRAIAAESGTLVPLPATDEYTILLRVVGPLCGYLSALQWFHQQVDQAIESPPNWVPRLTAEVDRQSPKLIAELAEDFERGVEFNFLGEVVEYAQNLSFKRVEGLFLPEPVRRDLLQFSHGPFQQNLASALSQWIFVEKGRTHEALVEAILPMFLRLPEETRIIASPLPAPHSIFYYELLLNRVLLEAIESCPHCQVNWPGKGEDSEGYGLNRPMG